MKKIIVIIGVCIIVISSVYVLTRTKKTTKNQFIPQVTVGIAQSAQNDTFFTFGATVAYKNEAQIRAQSMGVITFYVEKGDYVKKGDKIASIYVNELHSHIAQARIAVQNAEEAEKLARRKWSDYKPEQRNQIVNNTNNARQNLQSIKAQYQKTVIVAPFTGMIANTFVTNSSVVTIGMPIMNVVGEKNEKKICFDAHADATKSIQLDTKLNVKFKNNVENAVIYAREQDIDNMHQKVFVCAQLQDNSIIPIGSFVHIKVQNMHTIQKENYVRVLRDAIISQYDDVFVYRVDDQNVVHQIPVVVENVSDEFAIVSGIQVNDRIVVTGMKMLHDGDIVQINK